MRNIKPEKEISFNLKQTNKKTPTKISPALDYDQKVHDYQWESFLGSSCVPCSFSILYGLPVMLWNFWSLFVEWNVYATEQYATVFCDAAVTLSGERICELYFSS